MWRTSSRPSYRELVYVSTKPNLEDCRHHRLQCDRVCRPAGNFCLVRRLIQISDGYSIQPKFLYTQHTTMPDDSVIASTRIAKYTRRYHAPKIEIIRTEKTIRPGCKKLFRFESNMSKVALHCISRNLLRACVAGTDEPIIIEGSWDRFAESELALRVQQPLPQRVGKQFCDRTDLEF